MSSFLPTFNLPGVPFFSGGADPTVQKVVLPPFEATAERENASPPSTDGAASSGNGVCAALQKK